jgi:S-phase kinase-associated protein 1
MEEIIQQEFYLRYVESLTREQIRDITRAANFLGIAPLLSLMCAKVASYIRFHTPEEIRVNLGLSMDFTPEQEEAVRKENEWAKDL